jgi:hypothetical protein
MGDRKMAAAQHKVPVDEHRRCVEKRADRTSTIPSRAYPTQALPAFAIPALGHWHIAITARWRHAVG